LSGVFAGRGRRNGLPEAPAHLCSGTVTLAARVAQTHHLQPNRIIDGTIDIEKEWREAA
jgi:hypothetical protein